MGQDPEIYITVEVRGDMRYVAWEQHFPLRRPGRMSGRRVQNDERTRKLPRRLSSSIHYQFKFIRWVVLVQCTVLTTDFSAFDIGHTRLNRRIEKPAHQQSFFLCFYSWDCLLAALTTDYSFRA